MRLFGRQFPGKIIERFAKGHRGRHPMTSLCRRNASTLSVDNPYTGETFVEVPLVDTAGALELVDRSSAAQREWARTSIESRIELLERFIVAMKGSSDAIAADISGQMGKTLASARGEISGMTERCEAMMALAPDVLKSEVLPDKPGFRRLITKEPVGVVLTIAPWNYPILTTINSVAPAILSGNSVIIKHSARTPLCADHFVDAFLEAGAPEGLVTALHTGHDEVAQVIRHPSIGFVSFTGSVPGGGAVYRAVASERFIDATLELGGKDPGYVAEDANLDAAVDTLIDGAFFNNGQSCCGIERVYVHESKYDAFLEQAQTVLAGYRLGNPADASTTHGPLAQANACSFLQSQTDDAKARGARLLMGGSATVDAAGKGRFFQPTLLAECDHTMDIMTEESFGPVLGVAPVRSDEEAIALMNDSEYGLTASIFTGSEERAAEMAPRIETGTLFMNRCDYLDPLLPWTGVKNTGKGVSLSAHGFQGFNKLKGYHFKLLN